MVDYTHRSSGVSAKGILVTLAVIVGFFVVLAILGTNAVPTDSVAPAAEETAPAAPAVIE